jgi:hypothetical protein
MQNTTSEDVATARDGEVAAARGSEKQTSKILNERQQRLVATFRL